MHVQQNRFEFYHEIIILGNCLSQEQIDDAARVVCDKLRALSLSGACIDTFTADQLIIYLALSPGRSYLLVEPEPTDTCLHLLTAITVAEQLSGAKFSVHLVNPADDQIETIEDIQLTKDASGSKAPICSGKDSLSSTTKMCRLIVCDGVGL
mmetsp:Transcript_10876/g.14967  ORF Transcript_10876/g.14967 Transcript_10876/m.14967 type:complete len:152 (+) Transcript_10876:1145-1600(+)